MLKGIYGVLIAAFVAIVVGGVVTKAKHSWRAHQDVITTMQDSLHKQRRHRDEFIDRIARLQAQPTLSRNERRLVAEREDSLEGFDRMIAGQRAGLSRVQRAFQRTWVGNVFLLMGLAVFAVGIMVGSGKRLTREEKQWLASHPQDIPGLLLDPAARNSHAAPTRNASNFVTGRLKPANADVLRVTRSQVLSAMGWAFIVAPQGGLAVELYHLYDALLVSDLPFQQLEWGGMMESLLLSIPFTLAGLYLLSSGTSNARLDRREQTITLPGDNRTLAFNEVESVQLNQVLSTGERSFVNSQIQLNLRNGEALSLLSHGGKEQIYVDLIRTALFLDKPAVIPEA